MPMPHAQALKNAQDFARDLAPFCDRIEIVGSVRRQRPLVKDLELLVVPKFYVDTNMFGDEVGRISLLENAIGALAEEWSARFIKNGPKYKQLLVMGEFKFDLFICTPPAEFGVLQLLRTGPDGFSHQCVTSRSFRTKPVDGVSYPGLLPPGARPEEGAIYVGAERLVMPEERDLFAFIGLEYIEPHARTPILKPVFRKQ